MNTEDTVKAGVSVKLIWLYSTYDVQVYCIVHLALVPYSSIVHTALASTTLTTLVFRRMITLCKVLLEKKLSDRAVSVNPVNVSEGLCSLRNKVADFKIIRVWFWRYGPEMTRQNHPNDDRSRLTRLSSLHVPKPHLLKSPHFCAHQQWRTPPHKVCLRHASLCTLSPLHLVKWTSWTSAIYTFDYK